MFFLLQYSLAELKKCSGSLFGLKSSVLNGSSCSAVAYAGYFPLHSSHVVQLVPFTNAFCTFCSCLIELHSLFSSARDILSCESSSKGREISCCNTPLRHLNLLPLVKVRWFGQCSFLGPWYMLPFQGTFTKLLVYSTEFSVAD